MNPASIRGAARLQVRLRTLLDQRELLSDLGDIKESRRLTEEVNRVLTEAVARGVIPADSLGAVAGDWRRLAGWSDRVQEVLLKVDEMCAQAPSLQAKAKNRPSRDWLERWRIALETTRGELVAGLTTARSEIRSEDWVNGRPHAELIEVSGTVAPENQLKVATDETGRATTTDREQILAASWRAAQLNSKAVLERQQRIMAALERAADGLKLHARHRAALDQARKLIAAGEPAAARKCLEETPSVFSGLGYEEVGQALAKLETQLKDQENRGAEALAGAEKLWRAAADSFAVLPQFALIRDLKAAAVDLQSLAGEVGRGMADFSAGEARSRQAALAERIGAEREQLEARLLPKLRRRAGILTTCWLLLFGSIGVLAFQAHQRQEAERQRLVAEAKAKAEAEERERQRLAAEAKAKADAETRAAEGALAARLGFSLEAGARVQIGTVPARWIPAGSYVRGSPPSEAYRGRDEQQHQVILSRGFLLAETECTMAQWEAVMGGEHARLLAIMGRPLGPDHPVQNVSWLAAVEYCQKLTEQQRGKGLLPEGWAWRLPTEAEWEYAARAGATTARHGEIEAVAWTSIDSAGSTQPVGRKIANLWGLHDVLGNVWEWCADWYGQYPTESLIDPLGPDSGAERVYRGGSWRTNPLIGLARSADRDHWLAESRLDSVGFRPALSPVR
jgi:formylglycine-generating enzyme required for sulfatase activity